MSTQSGRSKVSRQGAQPRLRVGICDDLKPPSATHQLLMAFHFGTGTAPVDHPVVVSPGLAPMSGDDQFECWWYDGDVSYRHDGRVRLADCADYSVAICTLEDEGNIQEDTRQVYLELLVALSKCRHGRPVKIWNYIERINDGGADVERYRRFSVGRAEAFGRLGIDDELSPTGTAIGTHAESGLAVIAIATDSDFSLMENPRQVSAFRYPRQFGPRSPKFGRGGYVCTDNHRLYLISGTASVVGYESLHPFDAHAQLGEILRNLDALCQSLSPPTGGNGRFKLGSDSILRVYLRRPEDADAIESALRAGLKLGDTRLLMLHGDICRSELMVEVDGVHVQ